MAISTAVSLGRTTSLPRERKCEYTDVAAPYPPSTDENTRERAATLTTAPTSLNPTAPAAAPAPGLTPDEPPGASLSPPWAAEAAIINERPVSRYLDLLSVTRVPPSSSILTLAARSTLTPLRFPCTAWAIPSGALTFSKTTRNSPLWCSLLAGFARVTLPTIRLLAAITG